MYQENQRSAALLVLRTSEPGGAIRRTKRTETPFLLVHMEEAMPVSTMKGSQSADGVVAFLRQEGSTVAPSQLTLWEREHAGSGRRGSAGATSLPVADGQRPARRGLH